jgi:hypothetical protein
MPRSAPRVHQLSLPRGVVRVHQLSRPVIGVVAFIDASELGFAVEEVTQR